MITINPFNIEQIETIDSLKVALFSLNFELRLYNTQNELDYHGKEDDLQLTMQRVQKKLKNVNTIIRKLGGNDEINIQYPTDTVSENATSELM